MKEYIIVAKTEADIDSLDAELTVNTAANPASNKSIVPIREVKVANARLGRSAGRDFPTCPPIFPMSGHHELSTSQHPSRCDL